MLFFVLNVLEMAQDLTNDIGSSPFVEHIIIILLSYAKLYIVFGVLNFETRL